ncbi:hypothetical protein Drorol1_Dr00027151, partial [Drosera rotundifolia]
MEDHSATATTASAAGKPRPASLIFQRMTFGEQNTVKEAHDILNYAFESGINILDVAEAYPIPMKKETQGKTDLYIGSWFKSQVRDK